MMRNRFALVVKWIVAVLVCWSLAAGVARADGVLHVDAQASPQGADGSAEHPFATIGAALAAARAGDTVEVAAGVYRERLRMPSGESGRPVTLRAADGARVVVSGCAEIRDWRPLGDGRWETELDWRPARLFVGNRPQRLAREPDEGWRPSERLEGATLFDPAFLRGAKTNGTGGEAYVWLRKGNTFGAFAVESIDGKAGSVTLAPAAAAALSSGDRYWLQNRVEWVDQPGEWAVEPKGDRFRVVFLPRDLADLRHTEAPRLDGSLLTARNIAHARIEGLELFGATRAGIEVFGCEGIEVRCSIVHGCATHGISFREVRGGTIAENIVFGNEYGVSVSFSRGVVVERNEICYQGVDGLLVTWRSDDITVRNNYVHHHLLWGHPDNVQLYREVTKARFLDNLFLAGGQSMMTEETRDGLLQGNMIVGSAAVMLIFGHSNAGGYCVHRNTLAFSGYSCMSLTWQDYDVRENVFFPGHATTVYGTRGISGYTGDRNLFFHSPRVADAALMATNDGWLKGLAAVQRLTGQDAHSIQADPRFRAAPIAYDVLDSKRLGDSTRDRWFLRRGGAMFEPGDLVEVNFDGVGRRVRSVEDGAITVDRPLGEKPVQHWLVANWGPLPGETPPPLDLRLAADSPGAALAENGESVGSTIDIKAYQCGDFDGDGRRDLPGLPPGVDPSAWQPW